MLILATPPVGYTEFVVYDINAATPEYPDSGSIATSYVTVVSVLVLTVLSPVSGSLIVVK